MKAMMISKLSTIANVVVGTGIQVLKAYALDRATVVICGENEICNAIGATINMVASGTGYCLLTVRARITNPSDSAARLPALSPAFDSHMV